MRKRLVRVHHGDMLRVLPTMRAASVDACVTDPPYHLTSCKKGGSGAASLNVASPAGRARISTGFMGKEWDGGDVALRPETWAEVFRVLKPGAHLLAFGGTRTFHRMVCAIEDAGFEIRDTIMWLYGTGFPKSLDVSKAIDKAAGATREIIGPRPGVNPRGAHKGHEGYQRPWQSDPDAVLRSVSRTAPATDAARQWDGWGTALKPGNEPLCLAQKPKQDTAEWVTIGSTLNKLWSTLWSMLPANVAAEHSRLSPPDCAEGRSGSAQWNVVPGRSTLDGSSARMDTSQFVLAVISSLNTVLSWSATLDGHCSHQSMFTTETASNTTTELRTLRFSLSQITPDIIIQAHKSGSWLIADAAPVVRYFSAAVAKLNATLELSALASAIEQDRRSSLDVGATPALNPICLARKPLHGTVAANVLAHGTGALNIDASRVPGRERTSYGLATARRSRGAVYGAPSDSADFDATKGRFPANVILDGSDEIEAAFAAFGKTRARGNTTPTKRNRSDGVLASHGTRWGVGGAAGPVDPGDTGTAARFFYSAKAGKADRAGSDHPTVKPQALMRYLVRLVTPPGGLVLDPFAGSGSTGQAARAEGFRAVLVEQDEKSVADIHARLAAPAALPKRRAPLRAVATLEAP